MDPKERTLDELTNLYVKDRISLEQYEKLAAEVQQSSDPEAVLRSALVPGHATESQKTSHVDLESRDLHTAPAPKFSGNSFPVLGQNGRPGDFFLCIMGDRRVDGRMLMSRSASSVTLMGSTTIDLRDIEIPESGLRLELVAIMGEVRVLVAPGTPVHFSVVPIMGEAVSRAEYPTAGTQTGVLEIAGMALMGSVTVRVVP